jgi:hypothetical protein
VFLLCRAAASFNNQFKRTANLWRFWFRLAALFTVARFDFRGVSSHLIGR